MVVKVESSSSRTLAAPQTTTSAAVAELKVDALPAMVAAAAGKGEQEG
jgi:hypothetical protein